jgi:hypothetical protein
METQSSKVDYVGQEPKTMRGNTMPFLQINQRVAFN